MRFVYFNARGLGETSRLLLAYLGVDYTDFRYPLEVIDFKTYNMVKAEFDEDKKNGELLKSLNKLPYLELDDGTIIPQSKSIERYIAKKFKVYGTTLEDEGKIDAICECIRDYKDLYKKAKMSENKEIELNNFFSVVLPERLNLLENLLENDYSVGGIFSLADMVIYSFVKEFFDDKESVKRAISNLEKIKSIVEKVSGNEKINKWLETRPVTAF